jgi:quinol monooxygenase YgiN
VDEEISWVVELTVRKGQIDQFKALTVEMANSARNEPGTLCFQRYLSPDEVSVYVYERYSSSSAAAIHLKTFTTTFSSKFSSIVERNRFVVFGRPSPELMALLSQFDAEYFTPLFDSAY